MDEKWHGIWPTYVFLITTDAVKMRNCYRSLFHNDEYLPINTSTLTAIRGIGEVIINFISRREREKGIRKGDAETQLPLATMFLKGAKFAFIRGTHKGSKFSESQPSIWLINCLINAHWNFYLPFCGTASF